MRALARTTIPAVFTPGVIHLPSVPLHRKVNRIDMGTADKVCAAALAIHEEAVRRDCAPADVSFILLELGGAFSAALAVDRGRIVDGMGGIVWSDRDPGRRCARRRGGVPRRARLEGDVVPRRRGDVPGDAAGRRSSRGRSKRLPRCGCRRRPRADVLLSGRMAVEAWVQEPLRRALGRVRVVEGFGSSAKHAAQGAALIAEGLAGGEARGLVDTLGLREATGTVLDYLHVIDRDTAARRIGVKLAAMTFLDLPPAARARRQRPPARLQEHLQPGRCCSPRWRAGRPNSSGLLDADDTRVMLQALTRLGVGCSDPGAGRRFRVQVRFRAAGVPGQAGGPVPGQCRHRVPAADGGAGAVRRRVPAARRAAHARAAHRRSRRRASRSMGARIDYEATDGYPPLRIHPGQVRSCDQRCAVRGDVSSQFLTALLLALPLAGAAASRSTASSSRSRTSRSRSI